MQVTPSDQSMYHVRNLDLTAHVVEPTGMEVHRGGIRHEAQQGDGLYAIARDYSNAFGISVTSSSLAKANSAALRDGLQAGELLTVPGLESHVDSAVLRQHPRLRQVDGGLRHVAKAGSTLDGIARHYRSTTGIRVTADQIHRANLERIPESGPLAGGIRLVIPGVTKSTPAVTNRTLSQLDDKPLMTLVSRLKGEDGSIRSSDTMRFSAIGSHAELASSGKAADAIALAEARLESDAPRSRTYAVVQAKDGKHWAVPMRGAEGGDLDHTDTVLSKGFRSDAREVVAVLQLTGDGVVTTRRFDR